MNYQVTFPQTVNFLRMIRLFFSVVNNIHTSTTTLNQDLNAKPIGLSNGNYF